MSIDVDGNELVKVQFYDPDVGYENLWAARVKRQRYRIESIPFFIYGVSLHDVVAASPDHEGRLQFTKVVEASGNRTLRVRSAEFAKNPAKRKAVTTRLERLDCGVEIQRGRLLAVNVPRTVDLKTVIEYLNGVRLRWEYGNPEGLNT